MMRFDKWLLAMMGLVVLVGVSAGCSAPLNHLGDAAHDMAPIETLPDYVQAAPLAVGEAYQYAVANPEILSAVPCYCGCGPMGHTSNYSCYVAGADAQGDLIFDEHAIGCSICVDITRDVMRLQAEGESLAAIRSTIDATYSLYGPSNMR